MKPSTHKRQWLTVFSCLVFALPLAATAAPPGGDRGGKVSVTAANPSEAFQGEQLTVTVSGSGFDAGSTAHYLVSGTTDASQVDVISVQYISSSELKTVIRPKANALVTDYDIEVQTYSGRKGKGTTLFRVKQTGQPLPPPPPTEPEARYWHNFTGNGGTTASASRLYLFGGDGAGWMPVPPELWSFSVAEAKWTVQAWTSSTKPDPRHHAGLSCGGGLCVMSNGVRGSYLKETWIYTEQGDAWSQLNCKRFTCPSGRARPAMAYDSARNEHLLFGGESSINGSWISLDDTYTFSNATGRWTRRSPKNVPPDRIWAAAAFVAGPVNRVVMFGGEKVFSNEPLCDMWSWTGNDWEQIEQINPDAGPCLDNHSMAWDGARLVVTGGFLDHTYGDLANESVWTFAFTADGKAGTWTWYPHWSDYFSQCTGSGVIPPGAQMAYDRPSGKMVFFGGTENIEGLAVAYDDLNVCK